MLKKTILSVLLPLLLLTYNCRQTTSSQSDAGIEKKDAISDPLPSWNEGNTKTAIIDFVNRVTEKDSPDFVPVADRIATFDNDGNLWSEQPLYFQLVFALDRVKELSSAHPEWEQKQPFKAVLEDDMEAVLQSGMHGLLELVMASHAGMSVVDFDSIVNNWLSTARHPRFNRPYTELVYQPMLELLDFLRDNDFKVFIVSGGGIEFMRAWVPRVYGIPSERIIGSSIKTIFEYADGSAIIRRLPEIDFIDDKQGKPVGIHKFIGKKPIFASGNSDGDLQMLQYTASNTLPSFMLYLHHTDEQREWAYDRNSHIGKLDKGLEEAGARGWTVIDMANDWKLVYPFELTQE